jgi:hypothetical protein
MLAELDTSRSIAYNNIVVKLKKAEARLKTGLQGLHSQNLARLTSAGNQDTFNRKISTKDEGINYEIRKGRCFYYSNTDHFIKECTEFIDIIRKQVIDEMKNDG